MEITINKKSGVPIELKQVSVGVGVPSHAPIPVEIAHSDISVSVEEKSDIGLQMVQQAAFGSGVIIMKSEEEYTALWMADKLEQRKWYVLYSPEGELLKIWMGRKLFARKGADGERKTNVFPLVFPIVF